MNEKLKLQFLILVLLCWSSFARAQGTAFTYQGALNDGAAPANGSYDLTFSLFDNLTSGNQLGVTLTNAGTGVSNGLFVVTLDFGAGNFDGTARWLEIGVSTNGSGSFATLSPRQALTPTPYAMFAANAASAASVVAGAVAPEQLATLAPPVDGQMLAFTGGSLKWTDPAIAGGSVWSLNGSSAFYDAGNVGIGTASPLEKLTIAGVTSFNNGFKVTGNSTSGTGIAIENTSSGGHKFDLLSGGVGDGIGVGAFGLYDETAGSYRLSIDSGGRVGIGTTAPAGKLTLRTGSGIFAGYGFEHTDGTVRLSTYVDGLGGWLGTRSNHPLNFYINDGNPSVTIDTGGATTFTPLGGYGSATFGTPNGESGLTIKSGNRADVRFNGLTLKLVAASGVGPPSSLNGIAINTAGNVGVGNINPGERLTVGGGSLADTKIEINAGGDTYAALRIANSAGSWNWQVTPSNDLPGGRLRLTDETTGQESVSITHAGNVSIKTLTIRGGADLAEPFELSKSDIAKGSVVVIDDEHPGHLKLSDRPYDTRVAGIVSGANGINPGIAIFQEGVNESGQNVALSGRVYVQADAAFGAIKPGDLLTTSETPGCAMKARDHSKAQGAILGKAMSSLKEGKGMVLVLVTLQ